MFKNKSYSLLVLTIISSLSKKKKVNENATDLYNNLGRVSHRRFLLSLIYRTFSFHFHGVKFVIESLRL